MKFEIPKRAELIRPNHLDSPVPAIPGERVGDWVNRFMVQERRVPNRLDFAKHQGFHHFRFIDPYDKTWTKPAPILARAREICTNHCDSDSWFVTADGTVWMATEEELIMFKLYW